MKSIGKPTTVRSGAFGGLGGSAQDGFAHAAAQPLTFFRVTVLGPARVCCTFNKKGQFDGVAEPTVAIGKNVVWYTGNWRVALSTDAGRTFRYFNPSTILPDEGLPFCCDQIVSYSPKANLFVWLLQYQCAVGTSNPPTANCEEQGTGGNRIRIAWASPESLKANEANPGDAWHFIDETPQDFGLPANAWFDRSSMSLNDLYVNWQVDVMRGPYASVLARVPLSDLTAVGKVQVWFKFGARQRMEAAQGPGNVSYYVAANTMSQDVIVSWEPYSILAFVHKIDHSSVPDCDWAMKGSNGVDWYGRVGHFPGAVESATVSGNTLYAAHGAGRAYCKDPAHAVLKQPGIFIATYDVNTWKETGEQWLWHPTSAYAWPALQTDQAGEVGITYHEAPSGQNARPVAGYLSPAPQYMWVLPAGLPYLTGDYYSLRPGETPQSFVMSAETVQNDFGTNFMHWDYIEYGHGAPPYVAPPDVSIRSPLDQANVKQGTKVTYTGVVTDPVDGAVPNAAIVWREDGKIIGNGLQISHTETVAGARKITLTATNADGKSATASITINVLAPPPPGAPIPSIISPADSTKVCAGNQDSNGWYATVQFQATATDPNKPPQPLTYSWMDIVNGGFATEVATDLSPKLKLYYQPTNPYKATSHDLYLTVANTSGKKGTTKIRLYVGWPCLQ